MAKGIEILEQLQGWTSGLAIPRFVIDCPGGGGKVPLSPQYVVSSAPEEISLRNYENRPYRYPEPADRDCTCPYDEKWVEAQRERPARPVASSTTPAQTRRR